MQSSVKGCIHEARCLAVLAVLAVFGSSLDPEHRSMSWRRPTRPMRRPRRRRGHGGPEPEAARDQDAPYREACAREGLNESECVGRLIWFKATGGNERFHTYTFQQRVGVLVDWFRVLRADQRDDRFWAWGIINDPSCCKPGDEDCPAKSLTRPTASTGAPVTTCCSSMWARPAMWTRPAA
jgi:hypothetical protein